MMTLEELQNKLVIERASKLKQFDDAYPDVGMAPSWEYFIDRAIKELKFEKILPMDYNHES